MDHRFYHILRSASREDFYQSINNPEDELHQVIWDLMETTLVDPGEIYDLDFKSKNDFQYHIEEGVAVHYSPVLSNKGGEPLGLQLGLSIRPYMSCLFTTTLRVAGVQERSNFKRLWQRYRDPLGGLLRRAKPMVRTSSKLPLVNHAPSVTDMMDRYFSLRDPNNCIELQYPFAEFDESDVAQDFMVYMGVVYQAIQDSCRAKTDTLEENFEKLHEFYSGHPPDLPVPLPCVEMRTTLDAE